MTVNCYSKMSLQQFAVAICIVQVLVVVLLLVVGIAIALEGEALLYCTTV